MQSSVGVIEVGIRKGKGTAWSTKVLVDQIESGVISILSIVIRMSLQNSTENIWMQLDQVM